MPVTAGMQTDARLSRSQAPPPAHMPPLVRVSEVVTTTRRAGTWLTWNEVASHVASGELRETHILEFKGEDYKSTESAKKELAKDVAALAIDGGFLIIGIVENKATGQATELASIPLQGVAERIDLICNSRIEPALAISISDHLRDPDDPTRGLVVIEVPATGIAHMVDHRYVGRGNCITRYLEHPEVQRLLAGRASDLDTAAAALAETDGIMAGAFGFRRMVLVAIPVPLLRPDVLRGPLSSGEWKQWLTECMAAANERVKKLESDAPAIAERIVTNWNWFIDGANTGSPTRVPGGIAMQFLRSGTLVHQIEVSEAGAVRIATNHVVVRPASNALGVSTVDLRKAMSIAVQGLALTAELAERVGRRGNYGLGVVLHGMNGVVATPLNGGQQPGLRSLDHRTTYGGEGYLQATVASSVELSEKLTPVLDRLFGPLLRSMDLGDPFHPDQDMY